MLKPPRLDGLRDAYKGLIDKPDLQNILEPTSDSSDKIFIPDGNANLEGMSFDYWSRVVLPIRENLFNQREYFDKTKAGYIHVRVDIMPPKSDDYDVDKAMQAIHEQIYLLSEKKELILSKATVHMPLFRVRAPMNTMLTDYGYYSSNAIFKTVLGSYE